MALLHCPSQAGGSSKLFRARCSTLFISTFALLCLFAALANAEEASPFHPSSVSFRCPLPCDNDVGHWALYSGIDRLDNCNQTVLFDLNLYTKINDTTPPVSVRACKAPSVPSNPRKWSLLNIFSRTSSSSDDKTNTSDTQQQKTDIQLSWRAWESPSDGADSAIQAAVDALTGQALLDKDGEKSILFAKAGKTMVGLYAGSQLSKRSVGDLIQEFGKRAKGNMKQVAAQTCKERSLGTQIVGIFADAAGDLESVRHALRKWNDAECIDSLGEGAAWEGASLAVIPGEDTHSLSKRGECKYTTVVAGDGCLAVADRCKVKEEELLNNNGNKDLCKKLVVGQHVCCSAGDLPDFSPQRNPDGSCKTYTVKKGDVCDSIAQSNSLTVKQLEERNKKTWGWGGCQFLMAGSPLCLSEGSPPMPAPVANAICGPQVAGSKRPEDMSKLAEMNPCPLSACCNVWGQCGITKDFCVSSPGDTGAPGTAKPGSSGCISSCGMKIVNNPSPPSKFIRVGYFEAWNLDRPCLHMLPRHIDTSRYTHIHFAFASLTKSFGVAMGKSQAMFDEFKALKGVKRVISFGGWAFSTEKDTLAIFREGVTPGKRQMFADNIAKYVIDQGLDGVDFDWEYPGAPDIPDVPPGSPDDGNNYLEFLKLVRKALPADKTIGIAAPSSYWYLRAFPIKEIAKVVDYVVFMTYDLHGQFDYGNKWAAEGCPSGNCLRHHLNQTEVETTLSMVTRAGVPANKIIVGMALYGRSFKMTTPGCWGPQCTYTGPASGAAPGRCTNTAGYISNFEIREIIARGGKVEQHSDKDGDILVYDDVQWVSWMSRERYDKQVKWITDLNFGGTSDWAIDLDADHDVGKGPGGGGPGGGGPGSGAPGGSGPGSGTPGSGAPGNGAPGGSGPGSGTPGNGAPGNGAPGGSGPGSGAPGGSKPGGSGSGDGIVYIGPDIWKQKDPQVKCNPPCTFVFPPWVLPSPTTISIPPATVTFEENWITTITVSGTPKTTSGASITTTVISIPPVTTTAINLWNKVWHGGANGESDEIWLSSSISLPPMILTQSSKSGVTDALRTWTYSPEPYPSPRPYTPTPEDRGAPGLGEGSATTSTSTGIPIIGGANGSGQGTKVPMLNPTAFPVGSETSKIGPGPQPTSKTTDPGPTTSGGASPTTDGSDKRPSPGVTDGDRPGPPPSDTDKPHPPPAGSASVVRVGGGPPGPTCIPIPILSPCGIRCLFNCNGGSFGCLGICGCIGPVCEKHECVGPSCSQGGSRKGGPADDPKDDPDPKHPKPTPKPNPKDPKDPKVPTDPKDDPDDCEEMVTASYCKVDCTVQKLPSTTKTECRKERCTKTTTACTATGSTTTSTTTVSCPSPIPLATYNPRDLAPTIGHGGAGGLIEPGDFSMMAEPPLPTRAPHSSKALSPAKSGHKPGDKPGDKPSPTKPGDKPSPTDPGDNVPLPAPPKALPPPKNPKHQLIITYERGIGNMIAGIGYWGVYTPPNGFDEGAKFDWCDDRRGRKEAPFFLEPKDQKYPPTLDLPMDVEGIKGCKYTGFDDRPGEFYCSVWRRPMTCVSWDRPGSEGFECSPVYAVYPRVICRW